MLWPFHRVGNRVPTDQKTWCMVCGQGFLDYSNYAGFAWPLVVGWCQGKRASFYFCCLWKFVKGQSSCVRCSWHEGMPPWHRVVESVPKWTVRRSINLKSSKSPVFDPARTDSDHHSHNIQSLCKADLQMFKILPSCWPVRHKPD
jgi:hypothetical protein